MQLFTFINIKTTRLMKRLYLQKSCIEKQYVSPLEKVIFTKTSY